MHFNFPQSEKGKLYLHLFSEVDGRVPSGAWGNFFLERTQEFFNNERLDLAPWAGTSPGACVISGHPSTIEMLRKLLNGEG